MSTSPRDRIMGVETEFGCFVVPEFGRPEGAVEAIKNHVFLDARMGVLDRHARDEVFEPAESGGFLRNGGRLYIDGAVFISMRWAATWNTPRPSAALFGT